MRFFVLPSVALLVGACALTLSACGSDATNNPPLGYPPDSGLFNPGNGNGGQYGSGTNTGFVCPPELQRCAHDFTYPYNNEQSVELRGDYRGASSWVTGDPMTHQGSVWKVTVNVPLGQSVQYKFLVNGTLHA